MHEKRKISFGKCRLGKGQVFNLFYTKGFPLGSLKIIAHFTLGWIPRSLFICSFIYMSHLLIACERLRFAHKYSSQAKSRVVGIQVTTRRNHVTFTLQTPISFSLVVICTKCFVYEIEIASIQHEFNTVALISSISDARHQHLYQNEWATITIPWLKQFYLPNDNKLVLSIQWNSFFTTRSFDWCELFWHKWIGKTNQMLFSLTLSD